MSWNALPAPVNAWWPLSAVSSIFSNDNRGVDFRYEVSDINGIRISDETWRNPRVYTSQLSGAP